MDSLASTITPSSYPTIWETVTAHASVTTALALRATCTQLRDMVDTSLLSHLVARGGYVVHIIGEAQFYTVSGHIRGQGPGVRTRIRGQFERGYFLSPREGGNLRVRVPPATSTRGAAIRRWCTVLDIDDHLTPADCRWIARIATPHTLRYRPCPAKDRPEFVDRQFSPFDIIQARVVVYSVRPGPVLDGEIRFPNISLPDRTRRFVLHQCPTDDPQRYVHVGGSRLRELVLVFRPAGGEDGNGLQGVNWYLTKLLAELPKVSVTIVGLEMDQEWRGLTMSDTPATWKVELRTREEHRAALVAGQWALEMEI